MQKENQADVAGTPTTKPEPFYYFFKFTKFYPYTQKQITLCAHGVCALYRALVDYL